MILAIFTAYYGEKLLINSGWNKEAVVTEEIGAVLKKLHPFPGDTRKDASRSHQD